MNTQPDLDMAIEEVINVIADYEQFDKKETMKFVQHAFELNDKYKSQFTGHDLLRFGNALYMSILFLVDQLERNDEKKEAAHIIYKTINRVELPIFEKRGLEEDLRKLGSIDNRKEAKIFLVGCYSDFEATDLYFFYWKEEDRVFTSETNLLQDIADFLGTQLKIVIDDSLCASFPDAEEASFHAHDMIKKLQEK